MKLLMSVLLWLLIVAGFAGFGFLYADHPLRPPAGPEPMIAFGGVGVGVASCLLAGLLIVGSVRARRMPRLLGAVLLLGSSAISILAPIPVMRAASLATPYRGTEGGFHLFQGEHAQWVFIVSYGFWFALAAFVVLAISILTVSQSEPPQQAGAANRSQPVGPERTRTSGAAGSGG